MSSDFHASNRKVAAAVKRLETDYHEFDLFADPHDVETLKKVITDLTRLL